MSLLLLLTDHPVLSIVLFVVTLRSALRSPFFEDKSSAYSAMETMRSRQAKQRIYLLRYPADEVSNLIALATLIRWFLNWLTRLAIAPIERVCVRFEKLAPPRLIGWIAVLGSAALFVVGVAISRGFIQTGVRSGFAIACFAGGCVLCSDLAAAALGSRWRVIPLLVATILAIPLLVAWSSAHVLLVAFGWDVPFLGYRYNFASEAVPPGNGWRLEIVDDETELFMETYGRVRGIYSGMSLKMRATGDLRAREFEGVERLLRRAYSSEPLRHSWTYFDLSVAHRIGDFIAERVENTTCT